MQNSIKKHIFKVIALSVLLIPIAVALPAQAATPDWNTTGSYEVAMNYLGADYGHNVTLNQDSAGNLTGNGGSPIGSNVYTWSITSGNVSDSAIQFVADYTATTDAVTPQTTLIVTGVIAQNGTMSGSWSDNYQGGIRSGTWSSTMGTTTALGTLVAEDFGVVNYNTSLGLIKGYTAGFGLTDATFAGAQSVVVQLFAGTNLLQTNTATAKVGVDITGSQISSPFDVQGTFDYVTDGYWTNVKEIQFGKNATATRAVAIVTLANGKVVTAENTNLTGDASILIDASTTPPIITMPTLKKQCKNGGWKTFTHHHSFKNQGQCIASVVSHK